MYEITTHLDYQYPKPGRRKDGLLMLLQEPCNSNNSYAKISHAVLSEVIVSVCDRTAISIKGTNTVYISGARDANIMMEVTWL